MTDHVTTPPATTPELPAVERTPYKRLRGLAVAAGRRHLGVPLRRQFPVDAFRAYHRLRRRLRPARYAPGDPFAVYLVDPHRIEDSVLARSPKRPQWGTVAAGDWDRERESFDDRLVARAIRQRFGEGRDWHETDLVEAFRRDLRLFGAAWEYTSMDGFEARCAELDVLYERMRRDGYRTQRSMGYTPLDEINVDIDRHGEPLWRCYGQHRLAIAKLLDIDRVPVIVPRRHRAGPDQPPLQHSE